MTFDKSFSTRRTLPLASRKSKFCFGKTDCDVLGDSPLSSDRETLRAVWRLFQKLKNTNAQTTVIELRDDLEKLNIEVSRTQIEVLAMHFGGVVRQNHITWRA